MTEAYIQGFLTKCAEHGVDGLRLLEKRAQRRAGGLSKLAREGFGIPPPWESREEYDRRMRKEDPGYAYVQDVEDRRREGDDNAEWNALRWQLAKNQRDNTHPTLVSGVPFRNREFLSRDTMPSNVVVNIGGYGEGGGNPFLGMHSVSPNPVLDGSHVPKDTVLSFQQSHDAAAQNAIDLLTGAGVPVTAIGHSYGGDTAAHLAKKNPHIPFHAIDPVGALDPVGPSERPSNLTVYRPNRSDPPDMYDWVAAIGQRYRPDDNVVWYSGGHVRGTPSVVDSIVAPDGTRPSAVENAVTL